MISAKWQSAKCKKRRTGPLGIPLCSCSILHFALSLGLCRVGSLRHLILHGLLAERKGDLGTAAGGLSEGTVGAGPRDALDVYRDLAQLNLRTGHTEAALHAAMRVRDLAPTESSSFLFLGHVYVARGDLAMAAQECEKALELDPENTKALENLANYYSTLNPQKALDYYKRYLAIDPEDAEIYFQMGFLYTKKKTIPWPKPSCRLQKIDRPGSSSGGFPSGPGRTL